MWFSTCLDVTTHFSSEAKIIVIARCGRWQNERNYEGVWTPSDKDTDKSKVVSMSMDGAPSIGGYNEGFAALLSKEIRYTVVPFHCII